MPRRAMLAGRLNRIGRVPEGQTRIVINGERFTPAAVVRIDGVEVESNVLAAY